MDKHINYNKLDLSKVISFDKFKKSNKGKYVFTLLIR